MRFISFLSQLGGLLLAAVIAIPGSAAAISLDIELGPASGLGPSDAFGRGTFEWSFGGSRVLDVVPNQTTTVLSFLSFSANYPAPDFDVIGCFDQTLSSTSLSVGLSVNGVTQSLSATVNFTYQCELLFPSTVRDSLRASLDLPNDDISFLLPDEGLVTVRLNDPSFLLLNDNFGADSIFDTASARAFVTELAVPEPQSLALLATAVALLFIRRQRRVLSP